MSRPALRDYLLGVVSLLFTLAIGCVTPAAEAATARYDFQLQASALGAGGAFGIDALPAAPLQGHLSFIGGGIGDIHFATPVPEPSTALMAGRCLRRRRWAPDGRCA